MVKHPANPGKHTAETNKSNRYIQIFEFYTSSHSALKISSAFNTASFITGDILFGHEIDASHRSSGTILVSV